ncbi:RRM domain-containing protein [Plasmodiophora brassicae]
MMVQRRAAVDPLLSAAQADAAALSAAKYDLEERLRQARMALARYDDSACVDVLLSDGDAPTRVLLLDNIRQSVSNVAVGVRLQALGPTRRTRPIPLFNRGDAVQAHLGTSAVLAEFATVDNARFALGILDGQPLGGARLRARYASEYPTATLSVFGPVSALPTPVLAAWFARFGTVSGVQRHGVAQGWLLVRFARDDQAAHCLVSLHAKLVCGLPVEIAFANDVDHLPLDVGHDDVDDDDDEGGGATTAKAWQAQLDRFDAIRSVLFGDSDGAIVDPAVLRRNARLLDAFQAAVDQAMRVETRDGAGRIAVTRGDILDRYKSTADPAVSLRQFMTDGAFQIIEEDGTDDAEVRSFQALCDADTVRRRDVLFYVDMVARIRQRCQGRGALTRADLLDLEPDLHADQLDAVPGQQHHWDVYGAADLILAHRLDRLRWLRPRLRVLYWALRLSPRHATRLPRADCVCLCRFAMFATDDVRQLDRLVSAVVDTPMDVDEFSSRCERVPGALYCFGITENALLDPAHARTYSAMVLDDVGRRWLDFRHRVQHAEFDLFAMRAQWPAKAISKRAAALERALHMRNGRQALLSYAALMCTISDGVQAPAARPSARAASSFESLLMGRIGALQAATSLADVRRPSTAARPIHRSNSDARLPAFRALPRCRSSSGPLTSGSVKARRARSASKRQ